MTLLQLLSAHLFTLYRTALSFVAATAVLHILCSFGWLQALGYGAMSVGGFWIGQGLVHLVNRAMGYRKSSPRDSVD